MRKIYSLVIMVIIMTVLTSTSVYASVATPKIKVTLNNKM